MSEQPAARAAARTAAGRAGAIRAGLIVVATVVASSAIARVLVVLGASEANAVLVYLVGVAFVAVRAGRWASIAASVLAVMGFNFFFTHPVHTLFVSDFEHLLTFAVLLVTGITVSELVTRAQASAIAAAGERLRADLLATVSHDMRTPLATIRGTASTLLDRSDLPAGERRELVHQVLAESDRLTRLVENLLHLGRLDDGRVRIRKEWYALDELLGVALSRLAPTEATERVRLDVPASVPFVPVDAELMVNALVNVLENALRYAPEGEVTVTARPEGDAVVIAVADRGPGLPTDEPERLFDRFVRGAPGARVRGTGLGLSICKAIAAVHGGTIDARNRPGGGAAFRLRVPLEGGMPSDDAEGIEVDE